jgi:hypothetical protein
MKKSGLDDFRKFQELDGLLCFEVMPDESDLMRPGRLLSRWTRDTSVCIGPDRRNLTWAQLRWMAERINTEQSEWRQEESLGLT